MKKKLNQFSDMHFSGAILMTEEEVKMLAEEMAKIIIESEKKMTFIFDIDGTLADCSHRLHYILPPDSSELQSIEDLDKFQPDWESFYKDCINDKPIIPVVKFAQNLIYAGHDIIFVTGRPERARDETWKWLELQDLTTHEPLLYMRADYDHREDYVYKKEIYEKEIKPHYHIDGVFEDRNQCVRMWRSLGLTCYQVADGNY